MGKPGRPVGAVAKQPMSCVPETMKPFMKVTTLLSLRDLAQVLGISYRSVLNLRSRHPEELPQPIYIGRVIRFRAEDVDEWIWSKKQEAKW